jgi:hypothetical protein
MRNHKNGANPREAGPLTSTLFLFVRDDIMLRCLCIVGYLEGHNNNMSRLVRKVPQKEKQDLLSDLL